MNIGGGAAGIRMDQGLKKITQKARNVDERRKREAKESEEHLQHIQYK